MRWEVVAGDKSIKIKYDLEWLKAVIGASAFSMVPFVSATTGFFDTKRSYPRSRNPGFSLLGEEKKDSSPSAGGREKLTYNPVSTLCDLFKEGTAGLPVPLSDVVILSKRATCAKASGTFTNFKAIGGNELPLNDKRSPGWRIFGYPMLCVIDKDCEIFGGEGGGKRGTFPGTQGEWRVVQCVFGAALTVEIRKRKLGVEVISREGFGSVFPTLADLPEGLRLDPGLLPPDEGAKAILAALDFADEFINKMRQKSVPVCIKDLNGYDDDALQSVDRLMSHLLGYMLSNLDASADAIAAEVAAYKGKLRSWKLDEDEEEGKLVVKYQITATLPVPKGLKIRKREKRLRIEKNEKKWKMFDSEKSDESGYGSESDYEDDQDELTTEEKKPSSWERFQIMTSLDEEKVSVLGDLAMKKISVLSGMAALRMAVAYGMNYSHLLFAKKKEEKELLVKEEESSSLSQWAPYFELKFDKLQKLVLHEAARILFFDGAPNPINIPKTEKVDLPKSLGAIIIDTTNNTTQEKAHYLAFFQNLLFRPKITTDPGGILLMVDSASKHPTGGDLVHGVLRVVGSRRSVNTFMYSFLLRHLKFKDAYGETVLSSQETEARREMIARRLVMRNQDFWQWLVEL